MELIEDTKETTTTDVKKKKNPYAAFDIDRKIEVEGKWKDFGSFQVKVARAGGEKTEYTKAMAKLSKKYDANSINRLSKTKQTKLLNELHIKTIVLDWECWDEDEEDWVSGIYSCKKEKIVPMSFEEVEDTFETYPELRNKILEFASDKDNYIKDEVVPN